MRPNAGGKSLQIKIPTDLFFLMMTLLLELSYTQIACMGSFVLTVVLIGFLITKKQAYGEARVL